MSIEVNEIAKEMLSRTIDKQEAMRRFESLSEDKKNQLISELKLKLLNYGQKTRKNTLEKKVLKAIDQRDLNEGHKVFIKNLAKNYQALVPKSKANVLEHQHYFVDQRRAFHLIKDLKELHFQITYKKAEGAHVYDVDGNKYIDISGDMGVNIFGHKADFIVNAVKESLDQGIPLAGYSEKIFEASKLFCELTGHERALFTQSGTEAVMFAIRIARAATGKKKIVIFEGAYHGLSDAVVAMKDQEGHVLAAGPGMLQEFADQIIVLDYGDINELDKIEALSSEIAGVLVEPVQSRHPYIQPFEFLKELRKLTLEKGIPLIFDEMITGFRVCPQGAQGYFKIKADIATYGKIPGGGLPTGIIAGSGKYMDLIDGGAWNFGDDSMPKSKRTGMAGTHSQNPLKIAAVFATLSEIKKRSSAKTSCDNCACFQKELNEKTSQLAEELNAFFVENNLPMVIDYFGSLFRFRFVESYWGITEALLFLLLRMKGIETNIQGNCFLTTAHTAEDIAAVISAVKASLETLIAEGFFPLAEADEDHTANKNTDKSESRNINTNINTNTNKSAARNLEAHKEISQVEKLMELIRADLHNFQKERH
jgi:glutamate-1-semialdehyde 2,1-aminomutase